MEFWLIVSSIGWYILAFSFLILFTVWMRSKILQTTELYISNNKSTKDLLERCHSLKEKTFYPTPYLLHPLLQSWASGHQHDIKDKLDFIIEEVNVKGGGHTSIAILQNSKRKLLKKTVVVILPGLTGSCNDNYIQRIAGALYELDYKVIVYHPRFNGSRLVLPTEGYLNILDDFKETMKIVHDNYKGHKLLGIGHSYGANLLVRYLGLVEDHSFIGAVSLANPCNFLLSESKLRGKLIDKALLKLLQKAAQKIDVPESTLKKFGINVEKIQECKTLYEFDLVFTIKAYGYATPEDYYWSISSSRYVNNIKIPLLIIQAKDDPVVEYNGIPKNLSSENQTIVAITQSGGHIGWIEGIFNLRRWYIKPVLEFLNTVESRQYFYQILSDPL